MVKHKNPSKRLPRRHRPGVIQHNLETARHLHRLLDMREAEQITREQHFWDREQRLQGSRLCACINRDRLCHCTKYSSIDEDSSGDEDLVPTPPSPLVTPTNEADDERSRTPLRNGYALTNDNPALHDEGPSQRSQTLPFPNSPSLGLRREASYTFPRCHADPPVTEEPWYVPPLPRSPCAPTESHESYTERPSSAALQLGHFRDRHQQLSHGYHDLSEDSVKLLENARRLEEGEGRALLNEHDEDALADVRQVMTP